MYEIREKRYKQELVEAPGELPSWTGRDVIDSERVIRVDTRRELRLELETFGLSSRHGILNESGIYVSTRYRLSWSPIVSVKLTVVKP